MMLIPSCARSLAAIIGFAEVCLPLSYMYVCMYVYEVFLCVGYKESDRRSYLQALDLVMDNNSEPLLQAKIVHTLRGRDNLCTHIPTYMHGQLEYTVNINHHMHTVIV